MSLYQMVFGDGEEGLPLLAALGFRMVADVGRYRAAWIEQNPDGGHRIAVYTRNGGGNREHYHEDDDYTCAACKMEALADHPLYLFDQDDAFDCTYATVYFQLPEDWREPVEQAEKEEGIDFSVVDTSQRWHDALAALEETAKK